MIGDDRRELIRYRIELAKQTIEDAQRLWDAQARGHSIVNRAYYAMFYAVLGLANLKSFVPRKHYNAIAFFDREFVRKSIFPKEMSASLHDAFDLRLECDYADFSEPTREEAATAMAEATTFVDIVSAYLQQQIDSDKAD